MGIYVHQPLLRGFPCKNHCQDRARRRSFSMVGGKAKANCLKACLTPPSLPCVPKKGDSRDPARIKSRIQAWVWEVSYVPQGVCSALAFCFYWYVSILLQTPCRPMPWKGSRCVGLAPGRAVRSAGPRQAGAPALPGVAAEGACSGAKLEATVMIATSASRSVAPPFRNPHKYQQTTVSHASPKNPKGV